MRAWWRSASTRTTASPARRYPATGEEGGHAPGSAELHAAIADKALTTFLRERFKGTRPIAEGRQLQELMLTGAIYTGVMGLESLASAPASTIDEESLDAAR